VRVCVCACVRACVCVLLHTMLVFQNCDVTCYTTASNVTHNKRTSGNNNDCFLNNNAGAFARRAHLYAYQNQNHKHNFIALVYTNKECDFVELYINK